MKSRACSRFVQPVAHLCATFSTIAVFSCATNSTVQAQSTSPAPSSPGYYTDPQTGIVYRQVTKTIERPVVETKTEQREQTVYRPQTVTETKPESRTVYTPVIQYEWQPRLEGRWNPFRQPTLAYHHVPQTRWESRNEVVHRTNTRTEWVAEKRTINVPQRLVRMEREQKIDYEAVGRVAPQQSPPSSNEQAIASRLRPLDSNTRVEAFSSPPTQIAQATTVYSPPRIAASSLGRMTSDPPRRSTSQAGLRSTELYPTPNQGYSGALPPASTGVATLPALPLWR
ncbi:putative secreted protein [Rhodopirellula maiorica SM1]|uniref:Putative secreted protein n=1 Tax=Rhodopirellula maiorica SM1 TaxID=1265738 RepID=M5RCI9_9BACT|nr:putative secreted protein [Rhodopirellula maiorica SM1]